jgi:ribosomal protein L29
MTLPKYKELAELNTVIKIETEIHILQKNLFDFRMKKSTNQGIKPHLFSHIKRRISQLNLKKSFLLKEKE